MRAVSCRGRFTLVALLASYQAPAWPSQRPRRLRPTNLRQCRCARKAKCSLSCVELCTAGLALCLAVRLRRAARLGSRTVADSLAQDDAPKAIKHIQFGVMSQSEIVALSEFEATRPDLYRGSETREPTPGGVLDRRLGVTDKTSDCETCGCKTIDCSGHMAFIRADGEGDGRVLTAQASSCPSSTSATSSRQSRSCRTSARCVGARTQARLIRSQTCARCLLTEEDRRKYLPRFRKPHLENMARQRLAKEVNTLCRKAIFCPHCSAVNGSVKKSGPLRIEHDKFRAKKTAGEKADWEATFGSAVRDNRELGNLVPKSKEDMNALRVITLFRRISAADCELLGLAPEVCRPEEFIWTYIPVPPVCIRPSVAQDNATNEDDLTVKLAEIVKLNTLIRASLDHGEPTTKIMVRLRSFAHR